jgi:hypothetical protein
MRLSRLQCLPDNLRYRGPQGERLDPLTRIRLQVNGRQLDDILPDNGPSFAPGEHSFVVPLAKGKNTVAVAALNEIGWSKAQDGTLTIMSESVGDLDRRGTLYILAVGVSKYPNEADLCKPKETCGLEFTGEDATAVADAMQQRLGRLHDKVARRVLVIALVEGMSGAADLNHDGRVDTAEHAEYLRKRVPELAAKLSGEQEPQFFKGRDAETYPLALR